MAGNGGRLPCIAPPIGFPEHHVIGVSLACEHGIMTAAQAPYAGDAVGLERGKRALQGLYSGKMRAVGPGAPHDVGASVKQQRDVAALDHCPDRFRRD